jgi:hypothetical protein
VGPTFALARVEGRRLLGPATAVAVVVAALVGVDGRSGVLDLRALSVETGFLLLPLALVVLVCAARAVVRSSRPGTEELFAALPAAPAVRTGAHLLSLLWPGGVAVALTTVLVGEAVARWDSIGTVDVLELAVGPIVVIGAGALGVVLAGWTGTSLAALAACPAIASLELWLMEDDLLFSPSRRLAFWVHHGNVPLELGLPRRPGWHAVYLCGLIGLAAAAALARHGLHRRLITGGTAAVAAVAVSATALAWPEPASTWASRNDRLARPDAHQVCTERGGIRYCAYPEYRELVRLWEAPVAGVRRAVPAAGWPVFAVTQRVQPGDRRSIADEHTRAQLPALVSRDGTHPDDGDVHPGLAWDRTGLGDLELGLAAAARVTGLPLAPPPSGVRCDTSGQARAVTALWLAGQATPAAERALRSLVAEGAPLPAGVDYGTVEVDVALELLRSDRADVPILTTGAFATQDLARRLDVETRTPRSAPRLAPSRPPPILRLPCP